MNKENNILANLENSQNIVLLYNSKDNEKLMYDLHRAVSKKFKKICLVTIHQPFSTIIKKFEKEKIDSSNYCFIDCISAKNKKVKDTEQCLYIPSPSALTQLSLAITKVQEHNVDLIILDNISSLLVYNKEASILKFLHALTTKIRETKTKVIYSILKESRKEFIADLTLFSDAVIESGGKETKKEDDALKTAKKDIDTLKADVSPTNVKKPLPKKPEKIIKKLPEEKTKEKLEKEIE